MSDLRIFGVQKSISDVKTPKTSTSASAATQMGLTEQLLYLGMCLTICKDQGQSCEHLYGDLNVNSCHLIRSYFWALISVECASSIELTQFKWVNVNHVTNH